MKDPEASVQVDLRSTTDSLRGHEWPVRQDGTLLDTAAVERPVTVEVQPPPALAPLADTVDDVEALLERNEALTEELRSRLDERRTHDEAEPEWPSTGERLGALSALGEDVEIAVRLRQRGEDGWFYTVSLSRPVESWPTADR